MQEVLKMESLPAGIYMFENMCKALDVPVTLMTKLDSKTEINVILSPCQPFVYLCMVGYWS